jgi:RES domain-containing protein
MRLWRLSSLRRARDFNGGYGLANSGRWNTPGRPVTYCSTVPSITALEITESDAGADYEINKRRQKRMQTKNR